MSNLKSINKKIKKINPSFIATTENMSIRLDGESFDMDEIIRAGKEAVTKDYLGVINNIVYKKAAPIKRNISNDESLNELEVDCLIIGGGITGLMILRELSKYDLKTLLIERNSDIALEESTLASPMISGKIDYNYKLKRAIHNYKSRKEYERILSELSVPYKNINNFVLLRNKTERFLSLIMLKDAKVFMVRNSSIVKTKRHTVSLDNRIIEKSPTALLLRDAKVIDPFRLSLGLAENSIKNGASISLDTECLDMVIEDTKIKYVITNKGRIKPKIVINASGLNSDKIADMAKDRTYSILSRVRTHFVLSKEFPLDIKSSISYFPKEEFYLHSTRVKKVIDYRKNPEQYISYGFRILPLPNGNVLLSSASKIELYNPKRTIRKEEIDTLLKETKEILGDITLNDSIRMYQSMDSITYEDELVSRMGIFTKNIYEIAGVNSESLSELPSVVSEIVEAIIDYLQKEQTKVKVNKKFNPHFAPFTLLNDYPQTLRGKMIKNNSKYGKIVCECLNVSLGEVEDTLNYKLKPLTLDAVKRRLNMTNSECQGMYCDLKIASIIAKRSKVDLLSVGTTSTSNKLYYKEDKKHE